jgi:hypothetical protein
MHYATHESPAIAVSESDELTVILDDLITQDAPEAAFVGVLSALPSTLSGERLMKVARAVRGALGSVAVNLPIMP